MGRDTDAACGQLALKSFDTVRGKKRNFDKPTTATGESGGGLCGSGGGSVDVEDLMSGGLSSASPTPGRLVKQRAKVTTFKSMKDKKKNNDKSGLNNAKEGVAEIKQRLGVKSLLAPTPQKTQKQKYTQTKDVSINGNDKVNVSVTDNQEKSKSSLSPIEMLEAELKTVQESQDTSVTTQSGINNTNNSEKHNPECEYAHVIGLSQGARRLVVGLLSVLVAVLSVLLYSRVTDM